MTITSEAFRLNGHSPNNKDLTLTSISGFASDISATVDWRNGAMKVTLFGRSVQELSSERRMQLEKDIRAAATAYVAGCYEKNKHLCVKCL